MAKVSVESLDVSGMRVLVRVDFNVPLLTGPDGSKSVSDDTRIRAALPTLDSIVSRDGSAVLLSHLGRPKEIADPELSLEPVATHLSHLTGANVSFYADSVGPKVVDAARRMAPGSILLLENTRFQPGEKANDSELAIFWASLCDYYVNDAFGSAHRAHASTEGVARVSATAAMGLLMQKEVGYLSRLLPGADSSLKRPFVAIIGGAKVSDKIGIIESLLSSVDFLLIGGAMAYTFLRAQSVETGNSLVEEDRIDLASDLLRGAPDRLALPSDHVVALEFQNDAPSQVVNQSIPEGYMGLDIGPDTIQAYRRIICSAGTVIWNGPMGVFEMPNFAPGTIAIAEALAEATESGALTIVGGGDSVAAITEAGLESRVSHVSTGGGAMLEFLQGKTLPGIAALTDAE
ncbi:MAG: phosphoglycerate kinase [Rhodothermia bacterium]|nr:MAG: phosphoglycerate kinase [Rhodothermia bacterium]